MARKVLFWLGKLMRLCEKKQNKCILKHSVLDWKQNINKTTKHEFLTNQFLKLNYHNVTSFCKSIDRCIITNNEDKIAVFAENGISWIDFERRINIVKSKVFQHQSVDAENTHLHF